MTTFLQASPYMQALACGLAVIALECLLVLECVLCYFRKWSYILSILATGILHCMITLAIVTLHGMYNLLEGTLPASTYLLSFNRIPAIFYIVYSIIVCCISMLAARHIYQQYTSQISPASIPEAIHNLDDGLLIYRQNGRPILMNRRISELAYQITGLPLVNANHLIQALTVPSAKEPFDRISFGSGITLRMPDHRVFEFRICELTFDQRHYTRLTAHDLTHLYQETNTLKEKQEELHQLQLRLVNALALAEETERERESLKLKLLIHERFGQTILQCQQCLTDTSLPENSLQDAFAEWKQTITDFQEAFSSRQASRQPAELLYNLEQLAETLHCKIVIRHENEYNRIALMHAPEPVFDAIREAFYNAVRHSHADCLYIDCESSEDGMVRYILSDNGTAAPDHITEGGGLSTVRHRLEQIGGHLQVICENGVKLIIELKQQDETE